MDRGIYVPTSFKTQTKQKNTSFWSIYQRPNKTPRERPHNGCIGTNSIMQEPHIHISRSWRKTLSMRFDDEWILQIKAPRFVLRSQIQAFIAKNQTWIQKHFLQIQERNKHTKNYLFWEEVSMSGDVEHFYKTEAKKYIVPRCNYLAEKYGFTHKGIRITSASSRWGSCSSKKTLNFSYRLIMSPRECIDYVIIHELCHLRQMNHSSKFWREVAAIMPDYKTWENHLKKEGWKYKI